MENNIPSQTEDQPQQSVDQSSKKNGLLPIIIMVLVLLTAGGYYLSTKTESTVSLDNTESSVPAPATESQTVTPTGEVKEFVVVGGNFKYDVSEMVVNKGDMVKITFKNAEGTHDFVLDEFNVRTTILKAEAEETIEFLADKTGTFEYYCSVGSHRQMGMKGSLVVQDIAS